MNPTLLLFTLCVQAAAVPYSSSRWQQDENDCDDEASFLQSQLILGSPHISPKATDTEVTARSKLTDIVSSSGRDVQADPSSTVALGTANSVSVPSPRASLRGAMRSSPQNAEVLSHGGGTSRGDQIISKMREEESHQEEVKLLANSVAAVSKGAADMAKALVEEGKAFEFIIIALLCAFVLMPVAFAVTALMFINFMPSLGLQTTNTQVKAKSFPLPGGLRAFRESLKPTVAQIKGCADGGTPALLAAPPQTIVGESLANDVEMQLDGGKNTNITVYDHFARARQSLLPHPLGASSDIIVGPTEVCFAAEILPYRQRDVDIQVREMGACGSGGSQLGIRIAIKEVGEDCGMMIESDGVLVCSLYTGAAVVEPGKLPQTHRRVDLLRAGSLAPIATLMREDAFDGKLPGRVVARGGEGICDVEDGPVLFEVLLDSHDRPMSVLLVDGRLIARVSISTKGCIELKTESADDLWLAVAGVLAALKLASPPLAAG